MSPLNVDGLAIELCHCEPLMAYYTLWSGAKVCVRHYEMAQNFAEAFRGELAARPPSEEETQWATRR